MRKRLSILVLFIFLIPIVTPFPTVHAEEPTSPSIFFTQTVDLYNVSYGENTDYVYLKILHELSQTGSVGILDNNTEFIAFVKNIDHRGEIVFTKDGDYIGRLIPVISGKVGDTWYVVPISGLDSIDSYGSVNGTDENGYWRNIYYNGSGTLTAYEYDNWGNSRDINITISDLSIKFYRESGSSKINFNISQSSFDLVDSGAGYLIVPIQSSKLRYVTYPFNGTDVTVDLLNVGKITDTGIILDFLDNAQTRIGQRFLWDDLIRQGNSSYFEVINVADYYGILVGTKGLGAKNIGDSWIVDPEFFIDEESGGLVISNQYTDWTGNAGYNISLNNANLCFEDIYNYFSGQTMVSGSSDGYNWGASVMYLGGTAYPRTRWMSADYHILEYSKAHIKILAEATGESSGCKANVTMNFYAGSPIITGNTKWIISSSDTTWLYRFSVKLIDYDFNIDTNEVTSTTDDYHATTDATYGGMGSIFIEGFDITAIEDVSDYSINYLWDFGDIAVSVDDTKSYNWTYILGDEDITPSTWIQEWDDELDEDYPTVDSVSGMTYEERNNETLQYDFLHSSGYDTSFDITPVDSEINFTSIKIRGWDTLFHSVKIDSVLAVEGTDYYSQYNSSGSELDITFIEVIESETTIEVDDLDTESFLSGWANRIDFNIEADRVGSDQVCPIRLRLGISSGIGTTDVSAIFDEVGANYKKIAITSSDGQNEFEVEVAMWDDSGEEAELYFRGEADSSTDTTYYLYFDNSHVDNPNVKDVGSTETIYPTYIDEKYLRVYHLSEGSGNFFDSTIYRGDVGTYSVNIRQEDGRNGGYSVDFAQSTPDYLSLGDLNLENYLSSTILAVANVDTIAVETGAIIGCLPTSDQFILDFTGSWRAFLYDPDFETVTTADAHLDTWTNVFVRYNNADLTTGYEMFIADDGQVLTSEDTNALKVTPWNSPSPTGTVVSIGGLDMGGDGSVDDNSLDGHVDELWYSTVALDTDYMEVVSYGFEDDLINWGSVETGDDSVDFPDSEASNVDSSADEGTLTSFSNVQAYPDSSFAQFTESLYEQWQFEDYVDLDDSDVDTSPDLGTHDVFNDEKATDGTFDTLTEENTGGVGGGSSPVIVSITETSPQSGSTHTIDYPATVDAGDLLIVVFTCDDDEAPVGCSAFTSIFNDDNSPQGSTVYIGWREAVGNEDGGTFTITTGNEGSCAYVFRITGAEDPDTQPPEVGSAITNSGTYINPPSVTPTGGSKNYLCIAVGSNDDDDDTIGYPSNMADNNQYSQQTTVTLGIATEEFTASSFDPEYFTIANTESYVGIAMAVHPVGGDPANYELDKEVQFTTVNTSKDNNYVCVKTGTQDAEALIFQVYDSGWVELDADLTASDWNNYSIASYIGATTTFRFLGSSESTDTDEGTWQIDSVLIEQWDDNYKLDQEVQWTTTADTYDTTTLCIYTGTFTDAEDIEVHVWDDGDTEWDSLFSDLTASDWNNISVTDYVDADELTIRFYDGTRSEDGTGTTWNVDSIFVLHETSTGDEYERDVSASITIVENVERVWSLLRVSTKDFTVTGNGYRVSWSLQRGITGSISISPEVYREWTLLRAIETPIAVASDGYRVSWSTSRETETDISFSGEVERSWSLLREITAS